MGKFLLEARGQDGSLIPQKVWLRGVVLDGVGKFVLSLHFRHDAKDDLQEVRFPFSLGSRRIPASLIGFHATVGKHHYHAEVKESSVAQDRYDEALADDSKCPIMLQEDRPGHFTARIGNVPAGATVVLDIEYVETQESDLSVEEGSMRLVFPGFDMIRKLHDNTLVDVESVCDASFDLNITVAYSGALLEGKYLPVCVSHKEAIVQELPETNQFIVTLALPVLPCSDIVIITPYSNAGPSALWCEEHDDNMTYLMMVGRVPKQEMLSDWKPHYELVVDLSGSMIGKPLVHLKQALEMFLRSLPVGATFNLTCFGTHYRTWYPERVDLNHINETIQRVHALDADMGGTNILTPLQSVMVRCQQEAGAHQSHDVVVLFTDGEVESRVEVQEWVQQNASPKLRVFAVGIGSRVDVALVKGIAAEGLGASCVVSDGCNLDHTLVTLLELSEQAFLNRAHVEWSMVDPMPSVASERKEGVANDEYKSASDGVIACVSSDVTVQTATEVNCALATTLTQSFVLPGQLVYATARIPTSLVGSLHAVTLCAEYVGGQTVRLPCQLMDQPGSYVSIQPRDMMNAGLDSSSLSAFSSSSEGMVVGDGTRCSVVRSLFAVSLVRQLEDKRKCGALELQIGHPEGLAVADASVALLQTSLHYNVLSSVTAFVMVTEAPMSDTSDESSAAKTQRTVFVAPPKRVFTPRGEMLCSLRDCSQDLQVQGMKFHRLAKKISLASRFISGMHSIGNSIGQWVNSLRSSKQDVLDAPNAPLSSNQSVSSLVAIPDNNNKQATIPATSLSSSSGSGVDALHRLISAQLPDGSFLANDDIFVIVGLAIPSTDEERSIRMLELQRAILDFMTRTGERKYRLIIRKLQAWILTTCCPPPQPINKITQSTNDPDAGAMPPIAPSPVYSQL